MRVLRLYLDQDLSKGSRVSLSPEQQNYLRNVMRITVGAKVCLFNGDNNEYDATVSSVDKKNVELNVEDVAVVDRESPLDIHLGQAITKGDRMDFSVQKSVELGVKQFTPLSTQHGVVNLKGDRLTKKIQHWQKIAYSAAEQCGRNVITVVHPEMTLEQWLVQQQASELKLVLSPDARKTISDIPRPEKSICLLIGPEGGFSKEEVGQAEAAGFEAISFGPRILRAETATIAVLAAVQSHWGDLG